MMHEIRIKLQSDLCVSAGDGYAGVIDTDIVLDKYGIPFIPARRLKGCLRDAAVYIYGENNSVINKIFGVKGDKKSGALHLENAAIEEYDSFIEMCIKNNMTANRVTELFTDTSASTAVVDTGEAKHDSLRFMRYVSKNKTWDHEQPLVFCAKVKIDDKYAGDFEKICKALRHIGYKRNRGFGCVKCTLVRNVSEIEKNLAVPENIADDKSYEIAYAIKLDEALMLPSKSSDESCDYISGQAVIGSLAGEYLKNHDADEFFDNMFLSGDVKFSNLYITNDKLQKYVPVPQIYGKIKQNNSIIDLSVYERKDEIVKPLKSGYINAELDMKKPLTERVYHNNLRDADGGLYVQNCIRKGQMFMGTISGKGTYIKTLAEILKEGNISFGRSKSAQYSSCTIKTLNIEEESHKKINFKKGEKIVYLFESDAILSDNFGGNDVSIEAVCSALGVDKTDLELESGLKYRTISGFLSVMRLQRAHTRAIAAGSAIVVKCKKDMDMNSIMYIGGRQNEGFGKIRIYKAGELLSDEICKLSLSESIHTKNHDEIKTMFDTIEKDEKMRNDAISYAVENKDNFINKWGSSFIGRVTLMLKQSNSELDFNSRIKSIKSDKNRKLAEKLVKDSDNKWEKDPQYKDWSKKQERLLIILTLAKYFLKEEKGEDAK